MKNLVAVEMISLKSEYVDIIVLYVCWFYDCSNQVRLLLYLKYKQCEHNLY